MTENQFGRKPRIIRSDQGGEYSSKALRRFYAEEGIKAEYTAAYSPQQNGVSERKNRSLSEMYRCMLLDAGMPKRFWAEAINTACYLQNRLPSTAVGCTPFEIWFERKPDLNHLRLFGCSAYVFVPAVKRKKLDEKAVKMTFVGYSGEHKAYRMLNLKTGQIQNSRDVRFSEIGNGSKEGDHHRHREKAADFTTPAKKEEVELTLNESPKVGAPHDVLQYSDSEEEFHGWDEDEAVFLQDSIFERDNARGVWEHDGEMDPVADEEELSPPVRRSQRPTAGVPPVR